MNDEGYEDGVTITPDGEYLFVQYGPVYLAGVAYHQTICAGASWSMYDIANCGNKDDSNWVFDNVGPTTRQSARGSPMVPSPADNSGT